MGIAANTPIMGYRDVDQNEIYSRLDRPDKKDADALTSLKKWADIAGIDAGVADAQALLETGNFRSTRYHNDNAIAGVGITSDGTIQPFTLDSVDESVQLYIQCLYSLVNRKAHPDIPLDGAVLRWFNSVWLPKVQSNAMPNVTTVGDLGLRYTENGDSRATWSWEDGKVPQSTYGTKLKNRLAEFYPNLPDRSKKPTTPQENPMSLAVKQKWLPSGNRNFPGLFLDNVAELWITVHETDNTDAGAGASMHATFVFNGGGSDTVSFHLTVDSREAWQMMVLDQVAWHAGDGCDDDGSIDVGCKRSVAIETCVNSDGNWQQTKLNLIELCVMIIRGDAKLSFGRAKGRFSPRRIGQHNKWSGKNCPRRIRAEGSWGVITGAIDAGSGITPPPDTTPPTTIELIFDGLDIEVAKRLFGTAKGEDGITYKFDKNGPVSRAWMDRGEATGSWPSLDEVWVYADGRRYFLFEDGFTVLDPPGPSTPPKVLKP